MTARDRAGEYRASINSRVLQGRFMRGNHPAPERKSNELEASLLDAMMNTGFHPAPSAGL